MQFNNFGNSITPITSNVVASSVGVGGGNEILSTSQLLRKLINNTSDAMPTLKPMVNSSTEYPLQTASSSSGFFSPYDTMTVINHNGQASTSPIFAFKQEKHSLILPDETCIGYSETTKEISDLLTSSESDICVGDFSCGGEVDIIPGLPGLQFKVPSETEGGCEQFKYCSLPITNSSQAQEIIAIASKAPYGKGELTLIDEKVRKSWQLEPSQFIISNPKWNDFIGNIVENELRKGLGIPKHKRITHNLYKLLLYEADGHFDYHRDTEKESGMFATLVVQLPSVYSGGELIVKHSGNEKIYDFSTNSSYKVSYTGFFCDCEHKVNRVLSGYRLCLIYNVCNNGSLDSIPQFNMRSKLEQSLIRLAETWKESEPPFIVWLLEHKYTMEGLSASNLKGKDQMLFTFLSQLNQEHLLFHLFIGFFEKEVSGQLDGDHYDYYGDPGDEYGSDEETDVEVRSDLMYNPSVEYNLKNVKTTSGARFSSLPMSMMLSNVIPYERLEDQHFEKSSIQHTGNEGTNLEKWYRNGCIVIVSRKFYTSVFHNNASSEDMEFICEQLFDEVAKMKPNALAQLIQFISKYAGKLSEELMIRDIMHSGNYDILKAYLDANPILTDFSWSALLRTFPISQLKDKFIEKVLDGAFKSTTLDRRDHIQFAINELSKDLNGNLYIKELLDKIFERMETQRLSNFYIQTVCRYLIDKQMEFPEKSISSILKQADLTVYQIMIPYLAQRDTLLLEEALLSLLDNFSCFVNCYALFFESSPNVNNQVLQERMQLRLPELTKSFYEPAMIITTYCQNNNVNEACQYAYNILRNSIWMEFTNQPQADMCISFVYMFCREYIPDNFNVITSSILNRCDTFEKVESVLIPLLKWLEINFRSGLFTPSFSILISGAVKTVSAHIQHVQQLPWSWKIEPLQHNCSKGVMYTYRSSLCETCESLKTYLLDPNRVTFEMRSSQAQRDHVSNNIEKLCKSSFLDIRKESRKITITKLSSPQHDIKKNLPTVQKLLKYLNSLQKQITVQQPSTAYQPTQLVLTNDYSENYSRINDYLDNLLSGCNQITQETRQKIFTFFMGENRNCQTSIYRRIEW